MFCLFMLFYAGITYFNVDRSIYSIHQYPKLYVFLLIYAIINSFLWAFQNSFHSKEKEKALKIGFATNKFTYIEKGHKKFNKYYFESPLKNTFL